jgi:hypothetical protein
MATWKAAAKLSSTMEDAVGASLGACDDNQASFTCSVFSCSAFFIEQLQFETGTACA